MKRINIKGDVVNNDSGWMYDWLGMDYVSPSKVIDALNEAGGEDVELEIASNGGDVIAASEIYSVLKNYSGQVIGQVVGVAASAASVISCACDTLKISPTAHIMIHNAWITTAGNKHDMESNAEMLNNVDESIVNAYELKTGQSREVLSDLMNKESWLNAQKSMELGFADEIMFEDKTVVANTNSSLIPSDAVNKLKNLMLKAEMANKPIDEPTEPTLLQKKLNILKGE